MVALNYDEENRIISADPLPEFRRDYKKIETKKLKKLIPAVHRGEEELDELYSPCMIKVEKNSVAHFIYDGSKITKAYGGMAGTVMNLTEHSPETPINYNEIAAVLSVVFNPDF